MSAEDYDDVPGFGAGLGPRYVYPDQPPKGYTCNFCSQPIKFMQRKAFNKDGSPHRCKTGQRQKEQPPETPQQATLFAMAAMNAIINASIQAAGIDHLHRMNFYDVADASWRMAAAMVSKEQAYREEIGDAP